MPVFIPRKREYWQRKPSGLVEIDWNHTLAPAAFIFAKGKEFYFFDRASANSSAGASDGEEVGEEFFKTPEVGTASLIPAQAIPQIDAKTVAMRFYSVNPPSSALYFGGFTGPAYDPLVVRSRSGRYLYWLPASGYDSYTTLGAPGTAANPALIAQTRPNSTDHVLWNDGAQVKTDTTGVADTTPVTGFYLSDIASNSLVFDFAFVSETEFDGAMLAELKAAPYQILKPRRSYWVMPTAAGGSAPIMASALRGA
ncbi:MAG: hypothetical protein AB9Q19_01275 [Candidatus Reddybacter sp.]